MLRQLFAEHAGRRFDLSVAVPAPPGPPRAAEPAFVVLSVDGQPRAEGTLDLFVRQFALRAMGEHDDLPAAAQTTPQPWPVRLEKWLLG